MVQRMTKLGRMWLGLARRISVGGALGSATAALTIMTGFIGPVASAPAAVVPQLVGVRAAQKGGFDRVVFDFRGGLPGQVRVAYVQALIEDASGRRIPMPGRAILELKMQSANAHDEQGRSTAPSTLTLALRNVMRIKRSGDFEAVVSYGIGLAKRRPFRVMRLHRPDRIVVDVGNRYHAARRRVWFMNLPGYVEGKGPEVSSVMRWVPAGNPAIGVMDRLFAGPTPTEVASGLRLVTSHATGFRSLSLSGGVAHVRLAGGCDSGGSTFTIANEIEPTLDQFPGVVAVKIYDPSGATDSPGGLTSSIPRCLEP